MKRALVFAVLALATAFVIAGVSGAASATARTGSKSQGRDRVCAALIRSRNPYSYPPGREWVWTIANGCVFTRDLPRPAGCLVDRELGCAAVPDVHVRYQGRESVFHLTLKGSPAKALGISNSGAARQLLVAHDGRGSKARQKLVIDFTGIEFDGIIPSNGLHGLVPDLGPILHWRIAYTLDGKKGLCCPYFDPGNPDRSPYEVAPQRLTAATP
jgi:hypothetical protein